MNKCQYLRFRHKKDILYQVCLKKRLEGHINENLCYMCDDKEYKKVKSIKKVSPTRIFVTNETYETVYLRDKGKCRLCGNDKGLHLHHIIYRSQNKHLINDVDNCIMLCVKCHLLVHSNKKKYQPILMEMIHNETNK